MSSTIYEPGIDRPLAEVKSSGEILFYHQDWLGNVAMLTNNAGTKVESYTYDVWGKANAFDSTGSPVPLTASSSRFLFTGREYDQETGLYDYRARSYGPALGRFLQTDPIDFGGGDGNLFRYVSNNPVNWVDPLGTDIWVGGWLHENINVGNPNGAHSSYGFGLNPLKPWTSENGFNGTIYEDFRDSKPKSSDMCLKTTPEQDRKAQDILDQMVDTEMPYRLTCPNCRTFARDMFKHFKTTFE